MKKGKSQNRKPAAGKPKAVTVDAARPAKPAKMAHRPKPQ